MTNPKNLKPPWKKGQTGNPNGRPKKAENFDEFRAVLLGFLNAPVAKNKIRLFRQMETMGRTTAGIKVLWAYGFGNVPDKLETTGSLGPAFEESYLKILEAVYGGRAKKDSGRSQT